LTTTIQIAKIGESHIENLGVLIGRVARMGVAIGVLGTGYIKKIKQRLQRMKSCKNTGMGMTGKWQSSDSQTAGSSPAISTHARKPLTKVTLAIRNN